jgi:hypothetical protein
VIPYERWPDWTIEAERVGWLTVDPTTLDPELVCVVDGWKPHYRVEVRADAIVFTSTLDPTHVVTYERGWLDAARGGPALPPTRRAQRKRARAT